MPEVYLPIFCKVWKLGRPPISPAALDFFYQSAAPVRGRVLLTALLLLSAPAARLIAPHPQVTGLYGWRTVCGSAEMAERTRDFCFGTDQI